MQNYKKSIFATKKKNKVFADSKKVSTFASAFEKQISVTRYESVRMALSSIG